MIQYSATIKRFDKQGEKTGWTYIDVPSSIANQLKPDYKKSFRVSGKLDNYPIDRVALLPVGEGNFILAVNADMRKGIRKNLGATIQIQLYTDERELHPPMDLMNCLQDEPDAASYFDSLPKSHQLYFGRWIDSAKTEETRAKRIAQAIVALSRKQGYSDMIRANKKVKTELGF
jgi:hypothetical protein